jgi:hypothetical protein
MVWPSSSVKVDLDNQSHAMPALFIQKLFCTQLRTLLSPVYQGSQALPKVGLLPLSNLFACTDVGALRCNRCTPPRS